jgi:hypothetical protein
LYEQMCVHDSLLEVSITNSPSFKRAWHDHKKSPIF